MAIDQVSTNPMIDDQRKLLHNSLSPNKKTLQRASLEMSLKPFKSLEPSAIDAVCTEALRQWQPLLEMAETASMLLWVSDGSEILTWNGELDDSFEWARYVGFANEEMFGHVTDKKDPHIARLYTESPVTFTYGDLKRVVDAFKRIASEQFGVLMEVGATFDAGPEFAYSDFKYKTHPEINKAEIGGKYVSLKTHYTVVCSWSKLKADHVSYAAFPDGIPEDLPFGEFLGKQCASYLPALGFDYIWFSNGFALSYFPWTYLGANYDGTNLAIADYEEVTSKVLSFWDLFKQECPDVRTETRGTNYGTGMDLAKDYIPMQDLYDKGYLAYPPPNSPWGALNYDFGLEITGYLSRIAEVPKDTYMYRFYANDPWFWQNPWFDYYDREPHDIYCPLAAARMNSDGGVELPGVVQILTIDTENGELQAESAAEIIPHIRKAFKDAPDQPGLVTWLYPFRELHDTLQADKQDTGRVFFHDWLIRNAINEGLPLNTVLGTDTFRKMSAEAKKKLKGTILLVSTLGLTKDLAWEIVALVQTGGRVLLYGDITQPDLLEMLQLERIQPLEGDFELNISLEQDEVGASGPSHVLRHRADIGDGGLSLSLRADVDSCTHVHAVAAQNGEERVFAVSRSETGWGGGRIGWMRGSLPFQPAGVTHLPLRQEETFYDSSVLLRYMLQPFGYQLSQKKQTTDSQSALLFISRHENAYWFTGCKQDSTVQLELGLPEGVPLFPGQSVQLGGETGLYALDRTFHEECRIVVSQSAKSKVLCRENQAFPTWNRQPSRNLTVWHLNDANVTLFPPVEAIVGGVVEIRLNEKEYLDITHAFQEDRIYLEGITGRIDVLW
ncbi:hypothetical protein A8709_15745 [Paenibacillus pectinilyticus]|uniref:Beta-galactosidase trimerisation domain-containing protein n=1 Tax=Paenibacillus pectinilyticus TaxID=512399 RepID=A0A1C1A4N7_9BACL|nr:hypothetical protein [Paenibacillus pectinilyticus]OCT15527.1 hypothetical protein A8709_15745 [Paenibacillus pectinilyticus]